MNINYTQTPTSEERLQASIASRQAKDLVAEYGAQESDGNESDNRTAIEKSRTRLLAYIAQLERRKP